MNPSTYHHSSNSALTNSFMRGDNVPPYTSTPPFAIPTDERYNHQLGRQPSLENGLPTIDTTYSSNPASAYGSPRDDDASRFGLGLSPVNAKGLSVLDAPLPASFDSNGISHAARYGPWPSSVPSKFGLESPSPSLNAAKDGRTSETLKMLHTSAFGSSDHLSPSAFAAIGADSNGFALAGSPSGGSAQRHQHHHLGGAGAGAQFGGDEYYGKRAMHSGSMRYAKPRLLSSSVPKIDRDWEAEFMFEEDYVPGALANEVLTPAEKARRGSTTMSSPLRGADATASEAGTGASSGAATATKFGSPVAAASPSRWGPLFQRQREEEEAGNGSSGASSSYGGSGSGGRAMKQHAGPAFSHVGSPLRNSSLASGIGAELNGDSPGSRSPRGVGGESFSVLTQQLRGTRLSDDGSSSPHLHPSAARTASGGQGSLAASIIGRERERERGMERHVSSGSIGSASAVGGRFTTPIDEEDPTFVFSMEEEDEAQMRTRKRVSGGHLGTSGGGLGSGWSYASAVAAKGAGSSGGGNARDGSAAVETR